MRLAAPRLNLAIGEIEPEQRATARNFISLTISTMSKYIVKGEEGADVDVVGTIFKPGDTVELQEDVAAPLVEAGTIEPAPAEGEATPEGEATATPEGEEAKG